MPECQPPGATALVPQPFSVPPAPSQGLSLAGPAHLLLPSSWAAGGPAEASGLHCCSVAYLVTYPLWLGRKGVLGEGAVAWSWANIYWGALS